MLKKTITFTDYDGNKRVEDFYFNLTKAEVSEMELSETGGLSNFLRKIVAERNNKKIIEMFKILILKAYGVKSDDGRRFVKNQEVRDDFSQTEAYSELFMELAVNAEAAAAFVNGITPHIESQDGVPVPIS
jgi:hypothetical protein